MDTSGSAVKRAVGACAIVVTLALWALWPLSAGATDSAQRYPVREGSCAGMRGGSLALCGVYCETLRCDVRPRRGCEGVRRGFERLTGSPVFPCDATCGDAVVDQPSEQCDGGVCGDGQACAADCTCPPPLRLCGNGVLDAGEQCDPLGVACADGQVCNADCTCPGPLCGNGVVDSGEGCDPAGGLCADGQACNADCTCPPSPCGNGRRDAGEECDPAGVACATGTVCNADCTCAPPVCGNGVVEVNEGCDPPGSVCAAGGLCSDGCTCPGTNPECQGATCGSFTACNPGTACAQPICATTAEGGGVCLEGATECGELSGCRSSADCVDGVCVVDSCCGRFVCIPVSGMCLP